MSSLRKLNANIYEKQAPKIYPQTAIQEKNIQALIYFQTKRQKDIKS